MSYLEYGKPGATQPTPLIQNIRSSGSFNILFKLIPLPTPLHRPTTVLQAFPVTLPSIVAILSYPTITVPFALPTCPNRLTFLYITISSCVSHLPMGSWNLEARRICVVTCGFSNLRWHWALRMESKWIAEIHYVFPVLSMPVVLSSD